MKDVLLARIQHNRLLSAEYIIWAASDRRAAEIAVRDGFVTSWRQLFVAKKYHTELTGQFGVWEYHLVARQYFDVCAD